VFAALAALVAVATLLSLLLIAPAPWMTMRAVTGFGFAGLITVIESWLNARANHRERGRLLGIYRIVDLVAITAGQFLLPQFGADGYQTFAVAALLFCASLLPITLSAQHDPLPPRTVSLDLRHLWQLSPVAVIACLTIGLTNGAFRAVGPVFAQASGLDVNQVAVFMSAGIVGGALLQYPLGWLSDRFDRRWILLMATAGASLTGLWLSGASTKVAFALFGGAFAFGAFTLPLYSLSIAHVNDRAAEGEHVGLSAGLLLFFACGAMLGPSLASLIMEAFGPAAFFMYTSILHAFLIFFLAYRIVQRGARPRTFKTKFVGLLRTSPILFALAHRRVGNSGRGDTDTS
jgi:MFS family permease